MSNQARDDEERANSVGGPRFCLLHSSCNKAAGFRSWCAAAVVFIFGFVQLSPKIERNSAFPSLLLQETGLLLHVPSVAPFEPPNGRRRIRGPSGATFFIVERHNQ